MEDQQQQQEGNLLSQSKINPNVVVKFWDSVLNLSKNWLNENSYGFLAKWLVLLGGFALMISAGLGLIFSIVAAIKSESFMYLAIGVGWVVAVSLLLYVVDRFATAGETLINSNPTTMSSVAFLDTVAVISLVTAVLSLVGMLIVAIHDGEFEPFVAGIGGCVLFLYIVIISANPKMINISIVETSGAGEEVLGILSFLMKGVLKFVPIGYGLGAIGGTVMLLVSLIKLFGDSPGQAIAMATSSGSMIAAAAFIPLGAYLFFIVYYLIIDLIGSILILPKKIDNLK